MFWKTDTETDTDFWKKRPKNRKPIPTLKTDTDPALDVTRRRSTNQFVAHAFLPLPQPNLVLDLLTQERCKAEFDLIGWLHTEMICPLKDGHPSKY